MRIFALACFLLVPFSAYADDKAVGSYPSDVPVFNNVKQSHEEVEEYWTPERMRNAQPMPMPAIDGEPVPLPGDCPEGQCPYGGEYQWRAYEGGVTGGVVEGEAAAPGE